MGKINSDNLWNNAQAGYAAYHLQAQKAKSVQKASVPMNAKQTSQAESVENLIKYLENKPIAEESGDTFTSTMGGVVPGLAIFEGPRGLAWLNKAKNLRVADGGKVIEAAKAGEEAIKCTQQLKNLATPVTESLKGIAKGSGKLTERVGNYFNSVAEFQKDAGKLSEAMTQTQKAAKAAAKAEKARKAGKVVEEAAQAAETVKEAGKLAKGLKSVKTTLGKPFAALAQKFPVLGKVGKVFKGSGTAGFAIFSGAIEFFTEVKPTFKELGAKAGVKQIGKSAVKVAADVTGWTVGAKAGAAAGAAIGSVFPGVGTAIGAAVGTFVGGLVGSWGAGKIAKAVTGPTEREKAQAQQTKTQAQTVMSDAKNIESLKKLAFEKAQASVQQNGYIDAETQKALDEINNLNNPFANTKVYA